MTDEEISALQERVNTLEAANTELTAERDSLRDENAQLKETNAQLTAETAETKKLNYTLARQLDTKPRATFEETLLSAMGVNKK